MSVECSKHTDGKIVCKFTGRMDTTKCTDAEKEVMGAIDGAEKIVFDLDGVEYIASSFLRLCSKISNNIQGGKFSIINLTNSGS